MEVVLILIGLSFIFSLSGLAAFFWASGNGQFDDLSRSGEESLIDTDDP